MGKQGKGQKSKRKPVSSETHYILPRRWLYISVGMGIVLLLAVILFLSRSQATVDPDFVPEVTGAPRLQVIQDTFDYGAVQVETRIQTVFRVRNVGDEDLIILDREPRVELVRGC